MAGKMKASVLHKKQDLRMEEVAKPKINDNEVLVEIKSNGICGSDLHFYEKGELGPFKVEKPYIPGHESSGVISEKVNSNSVSKIFLTDFFY